RLFRCCCAARSRASGQRQGRFCQNREANSSLRKASRITTSTMPQQLSDDANRRPMAWGRDISAVGHGVVHGGAEYSAPLLLTEQVVGKLATLIPLAPLHQPHNLAPIRAILVSHPSLPQVACFDTAFHVANRGSPRLSRFPE